MSTHTPGPWHVSIMGRLVETASFAPVGRTANLPNADEQAANGRLMAAAPELLQVAEIARDFWAEDAPLDVLQLIENAFAKVEGRDPVVIDDEPEQDTNPSDLLPQGHDMASVRDATLTAAAPEMLSVLREVADYWAGGDVPEELDAKMRDLLWRIEHPHGPPAPRTENQLQQDYGGAFDGNTVSSDADPGL